MMGTAYLWVVCIQDQHVCTDPLDQGSGRGELKTQAKRLNSGMREAGFPKNRPNKRTSQIMAQVPCSSLFIMFQKSYTKNGTCFPFRKIRADTTPLRQLMHTSNGCPACICTLSASKGFTGVPFSEKLYLGW